MNPSEPPKRILVVDDEPPISALVQRFLSRAGFVVVCAQNGQEALDQFRVASWDVVITDRAMPGMGGVDLARRIRALDPEIRIVLMTGNLLAADDQNFDAVLTKPFPIPELVEVIERVSTAAPHVCHIHG